MAKFLFTTFPYLTLMSPTVGPILWEKKNEKLLTPYIPRLAMAERSEFLVPDMDASGRKKHLDPETFRACVRQVLSTPSYRENAMQIRIESPISNTQ